MSNYAARGRTPPHAIMGDDPPSIVLIKEEHQLFRELFDRVEAAEGDALIALAGEIGARLLIHMKIEEDILYPALKEAIGVEEVDEGIVEHQVAGALILDIAGMTGREELFKSKVHVLGEETMHHIDEEDSKLFEPRQGGMEAGQDRSRGPRPATARAPRGALRSPRFHGA
ncbi:hemerythrin domain-containing protein [Sphingosinicella sp. YJ22]|uniref:hemerythrin domain-containing protein n=1 Tax=Sphingosinicella sp. YJ22 TaxID=1104780 RepID=UPI001FAF8229|nr:hemerythrin domain-containing protein [Sphingosinicella sp. YJ22]